MGQNDERYIHLTIVIVIVIHNVLSSELTELSVSSAFILNNEGRVHGKAESLNGSSQKDNGNNVARNKHANILLR